MRRLAVHFAESAAAIIFAIAFSIALGWVLEHASELIFATAWRMIKP